MTDLARKVAAMGAKKADEAGSWGRERSDD